MAGADAENLDVLPLRLFFRGLCRSLQEGENYLTPSDALWLGRPGYLHYVASKAGVYGLTHSMAHELGPDGIRVNTVSPGPVFTEIARETVTPQQKDAMLAAQAIKRPAAPQDMVGAVVFLLSDDSGWMTGQTLHLNGGLVHR